MPQVTEHPAAEECEEEAESWRRVCWGVAGVRRDREGVPGLLQDCAAGRCPALTTTQPGPVNHFLTFLPPFALPAGLPHQPPPSPCSPPGPPAPSPGFTRSPNLEAIFVIAPDVLKAVPRRDRRLARG